MKPPPLRRFLFALSLTQFSGVAQAADPDYCGQYARSAVEQSDALSVSGCFRGFDTRWHLDYQRHYNWCLTAPPGAADAELRYRRMRLANCQGGG
jgi:hypothetical protein